MYACRLCSFASGLRHFGLLMNWNGRFGKLVSVEDAEEYEVKCYYVARGLVFVVDGEDYEAD